MESSSTVPGQTAKLNERVGTLKKELMDVQDLLKMVVGGPLVHWTPETEAPFWGSLDFKGIGTDKKSLKMEKIKPELDKLKDYLIGKNIASNVAAELFERVVDILKGKKLGDYPHVNSIVKFALEESLLEILESDNELNLLREINVSKNQGRPFIVTFCGESGVGKTTSLAKICLWLIENDLSVLVAVCDTLQGDAVVKLGTLALHLNAIRSPIDGKPSVKLYGTEEYGEDDVDKVGVGAISFAQAHGYHVVLMDTAGSMQGIETMMAMAKFRADLILFVGEGLIGNDAADQLLELKHAMADITGQFNPRLTGIVLSKVDTIIGDKIGAAVSMAYITGKPILFVGNGENYTELKAMDWRAAISALLKRN